MGSAAFMILAAAEIAFKPLPIAPHIAMFLFAVASGAAMIPYSSVVCCAAAIIASFFLRETEQAVPRPAPPK